MKKLTFNIDGVSPCRADVFLSENTEYTRSYIKKLCDDGMLTFNGEVVKSNKVFKSAGVLELSVPDEVVADIEPKNIPLDIVYQDDDIVVINKPQGLTVHAGNGTNGDTLVNALLYHVDNLSGINGVIRPGIVHRIDKNTSGLLVVAKNDAAHKHLSSQLEYHGITREYHALCKGGFREAHGTVDKPIGRHPLDRKKMAVLTAPGAHAKEAVTHYEVLEAFGSVSYLKLYLETGRTHQIRVHMASLGHALLGDEVYGGSKIPFEKRHAPIFDGQMLHARRLSFIHPTTNEKMEFECPLPDNFLRALELLRSESE